MVPQPQCETFREPNQCQSLLQTLGVQLEDVSLSYRFALEEVKQSRAAEYNRIAQLVADLASANGSELQQTIDQVGIGYVLVPDASSQISG